MDVQRFKVKGKHQLDLACIKVVPKKEPKAVIQIFHGMGEYKDRYIPFMTYLAENGYAAYAHDHRKHGESVEHEDDYGMWTKEDRFSDVIDDCYFVTRKVLRDYPGTKIIVFGHSMGSIIARSYISRYALVAKASIIMGTLPPMKSSNAFAPITLAKFARTFKGKKRSDFLANLLNKPMMKSYTEPRTNLDWLTRDETIVDQYIDDKLCGYAYTPQFYVEFFQEIVRVNKEKVLLDTKDNPILFISGEADPVGDNGEGVKKVFHLYNAHGFTQLTLELVKEARHEVLNELENLTTYGFIKDWIAKNVG